MRELRKFVWVTFAELIVILGVGKENFVHVTFGGWIGDHHGLGRVSLGTFVTLPSWARHRVGHRSTRPDVLKSTVAPLAVIFRPTVA